MKKFAFFFALLIFAKLSYALTVDDVLKDVKSLPAVKITYPDKEDKQTEKYDIVNYDKIKAVQIFVLPSDKDEIKALFSKWYESGVNTIIVRCFHNNGDRFHGAKKSHIKEGVYFKTDEAPIIYDVLEEIIPIAKSFNLKVIAWMTTRYANYGENSFEPLIAFSLEQRKTIKSKGMNILSPTVQERILKIFQDLASYPIDGILLQDDLFLRYNEGFNNNTVRLFKEETGKDAKPELFFVKINGKIIYTDAFWEWRRWKSQKIAELVGKINKKVKQKNPSLKLIVNLTYEAVSNPKGALAWLAHDLSALKEVADYFSLMAYHRQIMDELNLDFYHTKQYLQAMINQCISTLPDAPQRFLFKIQVKDWETNEQINEADLRSLLSSASGIEHLSLALVPYPPDLSEALLKDIFYKKTLSKNR